MVSDPIRFFKITSDTELVAVAEVSLFEGVYLRGWQILDRGGEIEVLPPHKVYRDPVTGEDRIFSLLHFESEETGRRWVQRVKEEFLAWSKKTDSPPLPSLGNVEE